MIDGYNAKSCSALQRPFYTAVQAALRWCNLAEHEATILKSLDADLIPKIGQFPQWPCLQINTEKILDAIQHGELPYGRDGKTVPRGEQVTERRRTVRHTDMRVWMATHHPGSKPAFLFDDIERGAHSAISVESFNALQADRDALKARIERALEVHKALKHERDKIEAERVALAALVEGISVPGDRAETTYLTIIGALLELVRTPRPGRNSDAAVIRELIENYADMPGIAKSTLEAKLAAARRSLLS